MGSAIVNGFRTSRAAWPVAVILWAWSVLLAGPASMPFLAWLRGQLAYTPEGDRLLERFRFDLFAELTRSAQGPAWAALMGSIVAMVIVATLGRAFITGGLVDALSADASGSTLSRFFGGAGRSFLRNLALLVVNGMAMALAILLTSVITGVMAMPLQGSPSPLIAFLGLFGPLAVTGLIAVFFLIVYDYACIRTARGAGVWRGWLGAMLFVARRAFGAFGLWLAAGVATAVAALVYLGFRTLVPAGTWPLIVLMIVVQQLFVLVRAGIRVALVAAELHYMPVPAAAAVEPGPAPASPAPEPEPREQMSA